MAKRPAKKIAKKPARPVAKTKAKPSSSSKKAAAPAQVQAKAAKAPARPAPAPMATQPTPRAAAPAPPLPVIKPPSPEALGGFERGMAALQRKDYKGASALFQAVLDQFPSEGTLADRARVYLEAAARELRKLPTAGRSLEERLTSATLALNNHNDIEAARLATDVLNEDRSQDLAEYLLAVVAARGGDTATAVAHLRAAIALNPECRLQARQDEEFDGLIDSDEFHELLDGSSGSGGGASMRKPTRKLVR